MTKSFAIVITLLIVASSALPQSLTTESFSKAKAVLDRSVTAYGGTEELNAIGNVSLRIAGESVIVIRAAVREIWIVQSTRLSC